MSMRSLSIDPDAVCPLDMGTNARDETRLPERSEAFCAFHVTPSHDWRYAVPSVPYPAAKTLLAFLSSTAIARAGPGRVPSAVQLEFEKLYEAA
jgi:hypothetical protein